MMVFFFFKQKTAYEMRISDWSSDVCSSDLSGLLDRADVHEHVFAAVIANDEAKTLLSIEEFYNAFAFTDDLRGHSAPAASASAASRSEEHTSELQSLMRTSYAVFCLKKKKKKEQSQNPVTPPRHTYRIKNSI